MRIAKLTGMGIGISTNNKNITPLQSFYQLDATATNGDVVNFENFKGKKVMIVNLASQCGFTPQYAELEQLYQQKKDHLVILGFPSNDFGGQEPGTDQQIEQFCKINFGVTFPLFKKDHVKGKNKQQVYEWLCNADKNGWNNSEPSWNFCKYLVTEEGKLEKIFTSSVPPLSVL